MPLDPNYENKLQQWRSNQFHKLQGLDSQAQRHYAQQIDQQYNDAMSQYRTRFQQEREQDMAQRREAGNASLDMAMALNMGMGLGIPQGQQQAEQPRAMGLQMGANQYDRAVNMGAERQMQDAERKMLAAFQAGDQMSFAKLVRDNPVVAKRNGFDIQTGINAEQGGGKGLRLNDNRDMQYLRPENLSMGMSMLSSRMQPRQAPANVGNKYELASNLVASGQASDFTDALQQIAMSERSLSPSDLQTINDMARQETAQRMGLNIDTNNGEVYGFAQDGGEGVTRADYTAAVEQARQGLMRQFSPAQPAQQNAGLQAPSFMSQGLVIPPAGLEALSNDELEAMIAPILAGGEERPPQQSARRGLQIPAQGTPGRRAMPMATIPQEERNRAIQAAKQAKAEIDSRGLVSRPDGWGTAARAFGALYGGSNYIDTYQTIADDVARQSGISRQALDAAMQQFYPDYVGY